jgi:hypothetical protein
MGSLFLLFRAVHTGNLLVEKTERALTLWVFCFYCVAQYSRTMCNHHVRRDLQIDVQERALLAS